VSALSEWAAELTAAADRIQASLAIDICRPQAEKFIEIEQLVTPKRSGHLARTETIDTVIGGGLHAEAVGGPHCIYAVFRNDGGTISAKDEAARSGRTYPSGKPYRHSLAWPGGFAMHVTQAGAHYVQKAEGAAPGPLAEIAERVLAFYLDF
jgi:hypothetical protein